MGQITIRNSISYQVDYLDLKGLGMDSNKIIKDLVNIQAITNVTESSHLSLVVDRIKHSTSYDGQRNQFMFYDVLYGLIGVPMSLYGKTNKLIKVNSSLDTSFLLENIRNEYFSITQRNKLKEQEFVTLKCDEKKKETNNIIGVAFVHTLVYESELVLLLKYMYEVNSLWYIMNDPILKGYAREYKEFGIVSKPNKEDSISIFSKKELPLYKNEEFQPKAFTLMIPVYEDLDFVQPFTEMCSKRTFFKDFSSLNWALSIYNQRNGRPNVFVYTNNETTGSVSVNFTYFPSKLNTNYYNKYVEGMTTTSQLSFIKSPILQSCFETIKEKENKEIWSDLNNSFCFIVMPENIINTILLNKYSGTNEFVNNLYISQTTPNFSNLFLKGTLYSSCIAKLFGGDYLNMKDWFKKSTEELKKGIADINTVCELYKIKPIVSIEMEHMFLLFIHYYFFIKLIEFNLSGKNHNTYILNGLTSGETTMIKTGFLMPRFSEKILNLVSTVVRTHTVEEAIETFTRTNEILLDYYKDIMVTFMSFDKDVKEIIESYHIGESTPYILETWRDANRIPPKDTYKEFKSNFYTSFGSSIDFAMVGIYTKLSKFIKKQLSLKYKNIEKNPKKRSIEYRLFDAVLLQYNMSYIKSFKIEHDKLGKHDEFFGVLEMLKSPLYVKLLEERLPYEEHIKRITTIFETIFNISRII